MDNQSETTLPQACAGDAYRESAATMLKRQIGDCERRLKGLKALLVVAEKAENGSPLEELLWDILWHRRSN